MSRKYKFHNKEGVLLVYCNFRGTRRDACASGGFLVYKTLRRVNFSTLLSKVHQVMYLHCRIQYTLTATALRYLTEMKNLKHHMKRIT